MRILITSEGYRFQTSGVAGVATNLVRQLRAMGHSVKVLALSNDRTSWKDNDDYFMGSFPSFYYPDLRMSFIRSNSLLKEIIKWRPDIIHSHTEGSTFRLAKKIAAVNNTPIVMTLHTDYETYLFGRCKDMRLLKIISGIGGYILYRKADAVIVPSEKARNYNMMNLVRNKTVRIPNGIDLSVFRKTLPADERRKLMNKYRLTDGKVMVIVSRLSREKDILLLLKALPPVLKKDPDAKLLIVGDGPQKAELEEYCLKHRLSESVCFTGLVPNNEVYSYYALGDVFVSASTFENMPLTYLEAMACGLPLLCKKDLCLKGILKHGFNGYVFKNSREFADLAHKLLNNSELNAEMRKKSMMLSQKFTVENNALRTVELYKKLIAEKKD